jgi:hypothetical protein
LRAVGAGDAEACGDWLRHAGDGGVGDQGADLLGDDGGVFGAGVGEQDEEFLAAVAPGEVAVAHARGERAGDGGQDVVAGAVSVGVVDSLEVIEVEQDGGERAAASLRAAWATMRLSVSRAARLLGMPVSASVAARCSAIAIVRRLAMTARTGSRFL